MLVVAQRFPPQGGGGVQRTAYFVHYLHRFGWKPHVLTGPAVAHRNMIDEGLNELIPDDVPVTRARFHDAANLNRALGKVRLARVFRTLTPFLPNMNGAWVPFAYPAGTRILAHERFDLIFSSSYPMGSHVTAYLLKRRFGIPWVADYRDEWSLRRMVPWQTELHHRLAKRIDRAFVATADQVVTTSPAHTESFAHAFEPRRPIQTITNGYDPSDFTGEALPGFGISDRFVIGHVGTVFGWRSPGVFLEAIAGLVDRGLIPADRIAVQFVGYGAPTGDAGLGAAGILRHAGYVTHAEAIAWMCASDLLLLFNTEETNIPGKTFEYLASRTPILALCEEGPTCDIVRDTGAGRVLRPDDKEGIEVTIKAAYDRWDAGRPALDTAAFDLLPFTRAHQARQLQDAFEQVLA